MCVCDECEGGQDVSECMCVCDVCVSDVCVCVDRREEAGGEGADTALKTKTPHVNVGKNASCIVFHGKCDHTCQNPRNQLQLQMLFLAGHLRLQILPPWAFLQLLCENSRHRSCEQGSSIILTGNFQHVNFLLWRTTTWA